MNLSKGKKIFLAGFIIILLVAIPLTIYLLQQQQDARSRAEKATVITFTPDSSATAPIKKKVGDTVPLDIMVNPGTNHVSYIKLEIQYDPEKLATTGATTFQANTVAFPTVLEGPVYSSGKIAVSLAVGPDPTKVIQTTTKAGTLTLKAIGKTQAGTPTLVTYGVTNTQVLSTGANDQASENVLSSTTPATIEIGGDDTPIPSGSPVPTAEVTPSDVPPTSAPVPTSPPVPTSTPSPTPGGGGGASNQAPVCNSLVLDRSGTGNPPFSVTFTANGSDTDGTVSKVTFNFGDGQVSDVTSGGGIGTAQANVQIAHTYNNVGTYQASAVLTDSNNGISSSVNCQQTITVQNPSSSGGSTTQPNPTAVPQPTMPPTGSVSTTIGIGAAAVVLMLGGGLLFFIL